MLATAAMQLLAAYSVFLACQTPFGTDRHVLEGDRIAAIHVSRDANGAHASAALVSSDALWSDDPVDQRWYVLADGQSAADIDPTVPADAEGPDPVLPNDATQIALVAAFPSGAERRATFEVPAADTAVSIAAIDLSVADAPAIADVTAPDLTRDARLAWTTAPASFVPVGSFGRFAAQTDDDAPALRWMGHGGGSLFELDDTRADWAAGAVSVDRKGEEIVDRQARDAGTESLLALVLGSDGATAFHAFDVWVGEPAVGVWVGDRWLPTDVAAPSGLVSGVLAADDASPTGLRLDGAASVDPTDLPTDDPYGVDALSCISVSGPFDPSWLVDGRCDRAQLIGAAIVVEAR